MVTLISLSIVLQVSEMFIPFPYRDCGLRMNISDADYVPACAGSDRDRDII